ncbi:MAG: hypothetical protein AAFV88_18620 [Planctomycetota bacterium]
MKRTTLSKLFGILAVSAMIAAPGCDSEPAASDANQTAVADDHADHDHGDDHEGHDHGDEGHDHGDESHEGHDHAGHDHAFKTLGDAVAEIESLNSEIAPKLAEGDISGAHDPLHHIGSVLVATEDFLEANNQGEKQAELTGAVETIMNAYMVVDKLLHPTEGKVDTDAVTKQFAEFSKPIEEAIATLKAGSAK